MMVFFLFGVLFSLFNWNILYLMLMVVLIMFFFYNPINYNYIFDLIYFDSISFCLVFLTLYIILLMLNSSQIIYKYKLNDLFYNFMLMMMLIFLFLSFTYGNMLMFYFFFESSLIPTFILILGWGVQPERLQASIYFFFYTLFLSIPLLFSLFISYNLNGSFMFWMNLMIFSNSNFMLLLMYFIFLFAFLVKMPMYMFHLWLPKAHVEAPVSGSMILAGVLLKLGGYGMYRFSMLLENSYLKFGWLIFSLSMFSSMLVSLICCRLSDMKALIAYSSVAHMSFLISMLVSQLSISFLGSLMLMISHGLTSSGLFYLINLLYERSGSRSIYLNKGSIQSLPLFTLLMFMFCCSNFSTPPFFSLISEIVLIFSLLNYTQVMYLFFFISSFLGTVFCVFLFSFSQHGEKYNLNYLMMNINLYEIHGSFLHLKSLLILLFMMYFLFN